MPPQTVVVVPCYNEAARLPTQRFEEFLSRHPDLGFLFVNDGSSDGTLPLLREMAPRHPGGRLEVIDLPRNQGKAEAVRRGMLRAIEQSPRYVGFWDADLATPLEVLPEFISLLDTHDSLDWVIGARVRLLGRRIERHAARHYLGRIFATVASWSLGIAVYDTQCGAKLFRRSSELETILLRPFQSRWLFDVELIGRYLNVLRARGEPVPDRRIYEFPLHAWSDVKGSKLGPADFLKAAVELTGIWFRLRAKTPSAGLPEVTVPAEERR
ncbi:MAG TPA: glycosyltransferase [Gemmatimonadales bacterium]|nr:glycosyltransferase [Gemmatimonadales bacterium]